MGEGTDIAGGGAEAEPDGTDDILSEAAGVSADASGQEGQETEWAGCGISL